MFSSAKKVAAVSPTPKAKSASKAAETIPGYAAVAALSACIAQLTGLLKLKDGPVRVTVKDRLIMDGLKHKKKPDSMDLVDGDATGSGYLAKRASNRPLAQSEIEVLAELFDVKPDPDNGSLTIPGITETRERQAGLLAVNPAYAGDEVLLARIDKALKAVKGLDIPDDFIIAQDAVTETIVWDGALDNLFGRSYEIVSGAFDIVGSLGLKPQFKDVTAAWKVVEELLNPEPEAKEAERAENKEILRTQLKASVAVDTGSRRSKRA
jgi:hypothetical protein